MPPRALERGSVLFWEGFVVPLVAVPAAGTTTERLSVRTLPSLMLILVLRDWMAVPDPVFAPVRAVTEESLEPRSKPARLVLSMRTGPLMMGDAVEPVMLRLVVRVPPWRREPDGRWTPTEGRNASSSSIDVAWVVTWRLMAVVGPLVW